MSFSTGLDNKIWLSDKGIKQALKQGAISNVEEKNIQPATIDVCLSNFFEIGSFERRAARYDKPVLSREFETFGDIKSSIRRNGVQAVHCPRESWFMLTNSCGQNYFLEKGESIGQLYIGGKRESLVSEFAHGYPLQTKEEIEKILAQGYLEIAQNPLIGEGFIGLHAGDKIFSRILKPFSKTSLKNKAKFDIPQVFQTQMLRKEGSWLSWPNSCNISLREEVKLSSHVALQMFYLTENNNVGLNGVVDPGYVGGLCCQPQIDCARLVTPGDLLVLAKPIFYPEGVKESYGGNRSSFQGTKCT